MILVVVVGSTYSIYRLARLLYLVVKKITLVEGILSYPTTSLSNLHITIPLLSYTIIIVVGNNIDLIPCANFEDSQKTLSMTRRS